MRFGIDFGTTSTVVATVDRGNYPVVTVADAAGDPQDHLPSVVALEGDRIVAGWQALEGDNPTLTRSVKRLLTASDVTADTPVRLGEQTRPLGQVLAAFAATVVDILRDIAGAESLEVVLGVPANALSAQRLLTIDAFTRAGATVLGLVNEPSAAAFEYTHRHARTLNTKRSSIIVYDLGGGTFDATLLRIDAHRHDVITSLGISRLGGDDIDAVLADLALAAAGRSGDVFGARARRRLLDEARTAKEQLRPQSRRIILELGDDDVIVPVTDFHDAATPLIEQTLTALRPLIGDSETLTDTDIAGIYLVGGATALPLVPRLLRERFGRRVHRSPLPTASTAVGLAIAADPDSDYALHDRLTRGIGVFRESDGGTAVSFDPLVAPGAPADDDGTITVTRRYRAAHNLGWFRFVEYAATADGEPGDLAPLAEVLVPFAADLVGSADLSQVAVERREDGPEVTETVLVDADGITTITVEVPELDVRVQVTAR